MLATCQVRKYETIGRQTPIQNLENFARGIRDGKYMSLLLFLRPSRGAAGLKSVRYSKLGVACLCPYPAGDKRRFSSLHVLGTDVERLHCMFFNWATQFNPT